MTIIQETALSIFLGFSLFLKHHLAIQIKVNHTNSVLFYVILTFYLKVVINID